MTSVPGAAAVARADERWRSLDGLRGIAAVVVLVHHGLLTLGSFADVYYGSERAATFSPMWWVAWTPLHLLWEGTGAVYVFFALSGFVLTLAVMRSPRFAWHSYYPARILRLMVPVWAAVCFAVTTIALVPRAGEVGSMWVSQRVHSASPAAVWESLTLSAAPATPYLVSPLWSLHFKVIFSLFLPLSVYGVVLTRRWPVVPLLVGVAGVALSGFVRGGAPGYLAIFLFGVILAVQKDRVVALGARISAGPRPQTVWSVLLVGSLLLLSWRWITPAVPLGAWSGLRELPPVIGAVLLVVVCAQWRVLERVLASRPALWLGTVSFSLYLVHEPIVIAMAYAFPAELRHVAVGVGFVASFVVAWLFWLAVERPAHRLSRHVGAWSGSVFMRPVRSRRPATPEAG